MDNRLTHKQLDYGVGKILYIVQFSIRKKFGSPLDHLFVFMSYRNSKDGIQSQYEGKMNVFHNFIGLEKLTKIIDCKTTNCNEFIITFDYGGIKTEVLLHQTKTEETEKSPCCLDIKLPEQKNENIKAKHENTIKKPTTIVEASEKIQTPRKSIISDTNDLTTKVDDLTKRFESMKECIENGQFKQKLKKIDQIKEENKLKIWRKGIEDQFKLLEEKTTNIEDKLNRDNNDIQYSSIINHNTYLSEKVQYLENLVTSKNELHNCFIQADQQELSNLKEPLTPKIELEHISKLDDGNTTISEIQRLEEKNIELQNKNNELQIKNKKLEERVNSLEIKFGMMNDSLESSKLEIKELKNSQTTVQKIESVTQDIITTFDDFEELKTTITGIKRDYDKVIEKQSDINIGQSEHRHRVDVMRKEFNKMVNRRLDSLEDYVKYSKENKQTYLPQHDSSKAQVNEKLMKLSNEIKDIKSTLTQNQQYQFDLVDTAKRIGVLEKKLSETRLNEFKPVENHVNNSLTSIKLVDHYNDKTTPRIVTLTPNNVEICHSVTCIDEERKALVIGYYETNIIVINVIIEVETQLLYSTKITPIQLQKLAFVLKHSNFILEDQSIHMIFNNQHIHLKGNNNISFWPQIVKLYHFMSVHCSNNINTLNDEDDNDPIILKEIQDKVEVNKIKEVDKIGVRVEKIHKVEAKGIKEHKVKDKVKKKHK